MTDGNTLLEAKDAFHRDDADGVREVFSRHPELKALINAPIDHFDSPLVIHVKSRQMLDVLLDAGADINARSRWWAGSFGVLDTVTPDVAAYAIERGATVDAHAAARLGLRDTLSSLLAANPTLVHGRGGDGQTPLHFAATTEIADLLIAAGADLNARDVDHESTPAQYMAAERQPIARHLVGKGAQSDLLLAAALGDDEGARRHLDEKPACIRMRVDGDWFPMSNPKAGGTIYNWTLGFYASAHEVANRFGHARLLQMLFDRTPPVPRLLEACWLGDEAAVSRYRAETPSLADAVSSGERQLIAHAARNNKTAAVKLMLECGMPVDVGGQHHGTPLHWAAFHGNADMVREILRFKPPLEATDRDFKGTPLGWAIHGSEHGWYVGTGNHAQAVELLLQAGAKRPETIGGSAAVREVLERR